MNIAIIFAGGSGVRMGAGVPKQFLEINGKPILIHTLQLFEEHEEIDRIYLAMNEDYIRYAQQLVLDHPCGHGQHQAPGCWITGLRRWRRSCREGRLRRIPSIMRFRGQQKRIRWIRSS